MRRQGLRLGLSIQGAAMATIDDQRLAREVDAAGPTVSQAHHAVRVARLKHCRRGRARPFHRSRRARRPHVSQYRPAGIADASAVAPTTGTDIRRTRGPVRTVVIASVAWGVLYIGFIRVFDPDLNNKALVLGVCLIAVTAAVCLNALTLDLLGSTAVARGGSSARAVPGGSAGESRDSRTGQFKEQR
jgi:hypothetical protein